MCIRDRSTTSKSASSISPSFLSFFFGSWLGSSFEVLSFWFYASGYIPLLNFSENPIYFIFLILLIPLLRDAHFYLVHRLLHFKFFYNIAHKIHHRNLNPGPWSSLSMHPVEHVLYFSGVIIHWLISVSYTHLTLPTIYSV